MFDDDVTVGAFRDHVFEAVATIALTVDVCHVARLVAFPINRRVADDTAIVVSLETIAP